LAEGLPAGPNTEALMKKVKEWRGKIDEYENHPTKRISLLEEEGKKAEAKTEEYEREADAKQAAAEHAHHQANRLDLGHLLAEVGLVVCSVAVLTKRRSFWLAGIAAAVLALGITGSAHLMENHAAHVATHAPNDDHGPGVPDETDHGPEKPGKEKSSH
jgi:hypothetical protein